MKPLPCPKKQHPLKKLLLKQRLIATRMNSEGVILKTRILKLSEYAIKADAESKAWEAVMLGSNITDRFSWRVEWMVQAGNGINAPTWERRWSNESDY